MIRPIFARAAVFFYTTAVLCTLMPVSASAAPLSAEAVIDQFFRSDVPLPGSDPKYDQLRQAYKIGSIQWLGAYQGVRTEKDRVVILFEAGQVPVTVAFKKNGDPDAVNVVGCPITSVPIAKAPTDWQKPLLKNCRNLKP
jgi:hypothetical protein